MSLTLIKFARYVYVPTLIIDGLLKYLSNSEKIELKISFTWLFANVSFSPYVCFNWLIIRVIKESCCNKINGLMWLDVSRLLISKFFLLVSILYLCIL